jgi:hypothetical protein
MSDPTNTRGTRVAPDAVVMFTETAVAEAAAIPRIVNAPAPSVPGFDATDGHEQADFIDRATRRAMP